MLLYGNVKVIDVCGGWIGWNTSNQPNHKTLHSAAYHNRRRAVVNADSILRLLASAISLDAGLSLLFLFVAT